MSRTNIERIATIKEQIAQLENQRKQLLQKEKESERKARTKRFCSRHGLLEKYMPDLITLTDEQFETFIKRGVATKYGRSVLTEIISARGVGINGNTPITEQCEV